MTVRFYSSTATPKNLVSSITNVTTTIQLSDTVGLPAQFPYTLALDYETPVEELVDVTSAAGTMLTITRAVDGTSATSHTAGAVVRHVSSARDFTDSRNHENSTTNVHGTQVGSAVVGTTDAQTLTNKTISGASLTGNFSGNPAFTGNPSFSGSPSFSGNVNYTGTIQSTQAASTNVSEANIVTGDTFDRFRIYADGKEEWGPGNAARDTNLYRSAVGTLKTDNSITVAGSILPLGKVSSVEATASTVALESKVTGDANTRWHVQADGKTFWGSGSATEDLSFQRSAAGIGQLTGSMSVAPTATNVDGLDVNLPTGTTGDLADFMVNGVSQAVFDNGGILRVYQNNTPLSYTPVLSGGGSATFSSTVGWFYRIGKMVQVYAYFAASGAGSGTGTVTISLPSTPFRNGAGPNTTRQFVTIHGGGIVAGSNSSTSGSFTGLVLAGGSGAMVDNIFGPTETLLRGDNIGSTAVITLEGWYREV